MNHAYVGKWAVRYQCERASIAALVCGVWMIVAALSLAAMGAFVLCAVTATLAGGFFGAALMALRIERRFRES